MQDFEYSAHKENYPDVEQSDAPSSRRKYKKKKRKIPLIRVFGALLVLFFLVYFSMLIYTSNFTMLETEQAGYFEINDFVEVKAYALRSEEYVHNTKGGILAYVIEDGEKVNAGGAVAKLFSSEAEMENWQEYNRKKRELSLLKQMTNAENNMFVDLDTVEAQIRNNLIDFKNYTQSNRLILAKDTKFDLQQLFNERIVITGGASDFDVRINELESEIKRINVSKDIGSVKSKNSGVFVSALDGYEKSLDFSNAEHLTADEVKGMLKKNPPLDAVGKVITTLNWYLLCPVTSEQAITVSSGDEIVDVSIPKVISRSIPGTIVKVNQGSKTQDGLMIIKCDYTDERLSAIREENITIKTRTYKGIRISRKAIHKDNVSVQDYNDDGEPVGGPHDVQVSGVYVLFGRRLYFKPVNIIYSEKDFVICGTDPSAPELYGQETVRLYDEVVVQGKELYNGKIIR